MEWNGMEWNGTIKGMSKRDDRVEWSDSTNVNESSESSKYDRVESNRVMEWNRVEWNGIEWNGVERVESRRRDVVEVSGVRMEWNGIEWSGVEWNRVESSGTR